jgi:midasin (ATPase involved in ribosome maturation)
MVSNREQKGVFLFYILLTTIHNRVDKTWTKPPVSPGPQFIPFANFWIEAGDQPVVEPAHYILTDSIKSNLANLARILVSRKYPILLQVQPPTLI